MEHIVLDSIELHLMILIHQVMHLDCKKPLAFLVLWHLHGETNQMIFWTIKLIKAHLFLHLVLHFMYSLTTDMMRPAVDAHGTSVTLKS